MRPSLLSWEAVKKVIPLFFCEMCNKRVVES